MLVPLKGSSVLAETRLLSVVVSRRVGKVPVLLVNAIDRNAGVV